MKKRVYTIDGKYLVEGDANLVTKDEILVEKTKEGIALKNQKGEPITVSGIPEYLKNALLYSKGTVRIGVFPITDPDKDSAITYSSLVSTLYYINSTSREYSMGSLSDERIENGTRRFIQDTVIHYMDKLAYDELGHVPDSINQMIQAIMNSYARKYGNFIKHNFSHAIEDPFFINFAMLLPDKLFTSYEAPLSEEELKGAIRGMMQAFKGVCSFTSYDSPIIGMLYTYTFDNTNGNRNDSVFFLYEDEIVGYTDVTLYKPSVVDSSFKNYNTDSERDTVYSMIAKIPENKFSISSTEGSKNYQYTYMIYNVAADKFYPVLHK